MEFMALENSSLTEEDFLLTEIKQETADEVQDLDSVAEWMVTQTEESSTTVLDNVQSEGSSDTEDAEITDLGEYDAADMKPESTSTEHFNHQHSASTRSFSDQLEPELKHQSTKKTRCCQICSQHFAQQKSLKAHMRTVHADQKLALTDIKRDVQTHALQPAEVGRSCRYSLRLRARQKTVDDDKAAVEKPHACGVCHRRFKITRDLNLHMRIHFGVKPHVCSDCDKQFTTISQLRSHHRTHTQEQSYTCSICGEKFVWLNTLKRHMRVHESGDDELSCSVCSDSFANLSELECHMLVHDAEPSSPSDNPSSKSAPRPRPVPKKKGANRSHRSRWSADSRSSCRICGKSVMDMRKHMLTHSGEKRHQCILCGSCFSIASTLTVHMRTHTGERPFGCDECGKRFTTRSHLTVHRRKHTREEPYQCSLCGEKFVWLNSLKRHTQLHDELDNQVYGNSVSEQVLSSTAALNSQVMSHNGENSMPSVDFPAAVLQGDLTSELAQQVSQHAQLPSEFSGKMSADALKHRQLTGRTSHQCYHCGRFYASSDSLANHMRLHTTEKKYVCAECGSRFRSMSHLHVHMRIHSEELHYECNVCGEKFVWQNSLQRHLWKHGVGREPKHQCPICSKRFFAPYSLRIHMQTHSGDKPHMCHQCGRRFSTRSSLRCHQIYSHLAQPRPCPECGKQFKSARVVRQHLRVAHQGTTHACPECGMEFRQQAWLDWHVMSHVADQPFTCDECQSICTSASDVTELTAGCITASRPEHTHDVDEADVVRKKDKAECDTRDTATDTASLPNSVIRSDVKSSCAVTGTTLSQSNALSDAAEGSNCSNTSGVDNEEYDGGRSINRASVPESGLELEGNTCNAETSFSDATERGKDCGDSIPASNGEYNGDVSFNNASVLDSGTTGVETSPLCADAIRRSEVDTGDRTVCLSREMDDSNMAMSTTASAAECEVRSSDDDEVRCIQCNKVRPPQCCPVCHHLFASLPSHIGTHSGKNPHTLSSLLGIRTTYADGDLQPVEAGGREQADGGGAAARPRKRKKHRVPQQCTVCGHTYTKLAQHMARMHSDGEPCMCPDCGKFLRNANTLRAHMSSKTCHKSRVCPICERTCENDAGLKSHMRSHAALHSGTDGPPVSGLKEHHCDECGHAFSSSKALDNHLALHAAGKHHICCVCGRTFIHARSLRLHLRMHTGETPFECKACGKGFRSRKGLLEHQSVHTMEKRFSCPVCGRRFRLRRTFSRHLVIHSGVKRYACEECGMRFPFSYLWKRHMRTHTGEKPYVCVDCGEQFTQWNGLNQHRRRRCGKETSVASLGLF